MEAAGWGARVRTGDPSLTQVVVRNVFRGRVCPSIPTPPPPRERLLRTPSTTPSAFFRAPMYGDSHRTIPQQPPVRHARKPRARRAKPGANAPPRQSEANAAEGGLRVGVGGAVLQKPYQLSSPATPNTTSAAAAPSGSPARARASGSVLRSFGASPSRGASRPSSSTPASAQTRSTSPMPPQALRSVAPASSRRSSSPARW